MTGIAEHVQSHVRAFLDQIAAEEDVRVCLAVESGSRAWGFASADSDYDVRFIYAHRRDWYLSIDDKRDVIERPLRGDLDVSGWDVRKALQLFRKSNPPLLEWLQSPYIYQEQGSLAATLRSLLPRFFSPDAGYFHYLHMANGNRREYLSGETVWRKKYLYVLRPLLAMRWIERGLGAVPIEFQRLVDGTVSERGVQEAIADLVEAKRQGNELDRGPHVPELSAFIDAELARVATVHVGRRAAAPSVEELNEVFRRTLDEPWR